MGYCISEIDRIGDLAIFGFNIIVGHDDGKTNPDGFSAELCGNCLSIPVGIGDGKNSVFDADDPVRTYHEGRSIVPDISDADDGVCDGLAAHLLLMIIYSTLHEGCFRYDPLAEVTLCSDPTLELLLSGGDQLVPHTILGSKHVGGSIDNFSGSGDEFLIMNGELDVADCYINTSFYNYGPPGSGYSYADGFHDYQADGIDDVNVYGAASFIDANSNKGGVGVTDITTGSTPFGFAEGLYGEAADGDIIFDAPRWLIVDLIADEA